MAALNKVQLIGYLGVDPELRFTQAGTPVAQLSMATTRKWRPNKDSDELEEETTWHRIVCWNKLGERCDKYLKKGSQVYVEGRLRTFSYEKDGEKKYGHEIVAWEVQFLDRGNGNRPPHAAERRDEPPAEGFGPDAYVPTDPGNDDIPF